MKIYVPFLFWFSIVFAQTEPTKDLHKNDPRVWALSNAKIHTEPGDSIKDGTIIIRNGKIEKVGRYIKIPKDAYEIDLEGAHVYSGFIDRQSKYVINGQRIYEYYGYEWRLPLWDKGLRLGCMGYRFRIGFLGCGFGIRFYGI